MFLNRFHSKIRVRALQFGAVPPGIMNRNDEERSIEPSSSSAPKKRRIRGPYKAYLMDPQKPVPESTLRSRAQASGDGNDGVSLRPAHLQELTGSIPAQEVSYDTDVDPAGAAAEAADAEAADAKAADAEAADTSTSRKPSEYNDGDLPSSPDSNDNVDNDQNLLEVENDYNEQDDVDHQDNPSQCKKTLEEKHGLNYCLHKDLSCTKLEAPLMILHMAYRHCYTEHFIEDQMKFVNGLFGSTVLDVSYYLYQTLFQPSSSPLRHYFCSSCEVSVGTQKDFSTQTKFVKCQKCNKDIDVPSFDSGNYFVSISLKEQSESIINMSGTKLIKLDGRDSEKISDMCDGELYKTCLQPGGPFSDKQIFTVTLNTDGVSVFKSTNNSMWPILMYVNEICPKQRFKIENLILGGLWFGKSAPNMALFMKPVLEDLKYLKVEGVIYIKADGSKVKCPVYGTSISLDAVAKAKCLCMKQFNGMMGCLYCMHPNDTVVEDENRPNNRLQRHYDTSVTYPTRTEIEVIRDMYTADTLQRKNQLGSNSVNGFLGLSVLLTIVVEYSKLFPGFRVFSIVWSVIIDYLHKSLEGVMGDLLEAIEYILTPEQREILNERLLAIAPPQGMTRNPRYLNDRVHWKAKEYRGFLLYYGLPCLEDLLPLPVFSIFKLFSRSCYILSKDGISSRDLEEARAGLKKFVVDYQKVFGLKKVTCNLHVSTHLADLVQRMGPLWSYSQLYFRVRQWTPRQTHTRDQICCA